MKRASQKKDQVRKRTGQEEGLAPADQEFFIERGQAPLPDLFFSPGLFILVSL